MTGFDVLKERVLVVVRGLRNRRLATGVGAGVLAVVIAAYLTWIYSSARDVEKMLDRTEALDVSGIASGDEAALLAAQKLVDDSNDATSSLSRRLGPIRVAEAILGWMPWAGDQLEAPQLLLDRAEAALDTTEPLIAAAGDLFLLRDAFASGVLEGNGEFEAAVRSLEANAAETSARIDRVVEASDAMDGLSLLGIFERRADRVTSLEDRLIGFANLLVGAPGTIEDAREVLNTGSVVADLLDGTSEDLDLARMAAAITDLAIAAERSKGSVARLAELGAAAAPGTGLEGFTSAIASSITAVGDLSAGFATIVDVFGDAAEILGNSEGSLLSDGDSLQRALNTLVLERERLQQAVELTSVALEELDRVRESGDANFIPDELADTLLDRANGITAAAGLLLDGPELLLGMTGADSPKKYLVLGQTSDELRAAGGFTSSVWTLSFNDGALTQTDFIPVLRFENRNILAQGGSPAEPLSYYMNTGALYLRDVGWDPDFTSVARLASDLHELHRGEEIDGVIAVTQWGITRLVEAVGGIEVDGVFISPRQILNTIEQGTDDEGTRFLEQLFVGLLDSLDGGLFADPDFELFRALQEIVTHKDVMIFSSDDHEQKLIESLGLAGQFPVDSRDRLAVIDSNVGWSKSDRSISRSAGYSVDLSDPAQPAARLTLGYLNTGTEIGRDCGLQSPPPADVAIYSVSINSCYWNYVRAYVANGITLTDAPALPLPPNSVPDQQGRQEPGTPTFAHNFDAFGDHLAGLMNVAPGETTHFSFEFNMPPGILQRTESGFTYELALVAQPGARGRQITVELTPPGGHSLGSSSHEASHTSYGTVRFLFNLVTDQVLRAEFVAD